MKKEVERYAAKLGMKLEDLCRPSRKTNAVDKRHAVWFILRKKGYTTIDIADFFELRSHATIIYGCSRVQNLLDINDKKMSSLISLLKGSV